MSINAHPWKKLITAVAFVLMTIPTVVASQTKVPSGRLYRIQVGKRYGFINRKGKIIVAPNLEDAGEFHEGLAFVSRDGRRYGYIDVRGTMVISARLTMAWDFSEGLAAASSRSISKDREVTYGFIDRSGHFVIPERYASYEGDPGDGPLPLGYGLKSVEENTRYQAAMCHGGKIEVAWDRFVDRRGRAIAGKSRRYPNHPSDYGPLREGRKSFYYPVSYDGSSQLWYVRNDGVTEPPQQIFVPRTSDRKPAPGLNYFSESRAPIWRFTPDGKVWFGYVNTRGAIKVPMECEEIHPFTGGLALIVRRNRYEYIDSEGRTIWREP